MTKRIFAVIMVAMIVVAMAVPAFAADAAATAQTAMQSALDTMVNNAISMILIALPSGLVIFGIVWGVKKGLAVLKNSSNG